MADPCRDAPLRSSGKGPLIRIAYVTYVRTFNLLLDLRRKVSVPDHCGPAACCPSLQRGSALPHQGTPDSLRLRQRMRRRLAQMADHITLCSTPRFDHLPMAMTSESVIGSGHIEKPCSNQKLERATLSRGSCRRRRGLIRFANLLAIMSVIVCIRQTARGGMAEEGGHRSSTVLFLALPVSRTVTYFRTFASPSSWTPQQLLTWGVTGVCSRSANCPGRWSGATVVLVASASCY